VGASPTDGALAARRHGGPSADGTGVRILTGLDDHSRFCVVAHAMPRATARPVCEAFAEALRACGVPQAVLTDNGRVFTGRHARTRREVLGLLHWLQASASRRLAR
jgi:transposase InsO family protein